MRSRLAAQKRLAVDGARVSDDHHRLVAAPVDRFGVPHASCHGAHWQVLREALGELEIPGDVEGER